MIVTNADGRDTYTSIEEFQFTDGVVAFGNLDGSPNDISAAIAAPQGEWVI